MPTNSADVRLPIEDGCDGKPFGGGAFRAKGRTTVPPGETLVGIPACTLSDAEWRSFPSTDANCHHWFFGFM